MNAEVQEKIAKLEAEMSEASFWQNKEHAQAVIREHQELKETLAHGAGYDRSPAILSIFAGAGGDDAEDFAAMLFLMYRKYIEKRGWPMKLLH